MTSRFEVPEWRYISKQILLHCTTTQPAVMLIWWVSVSDLMVLVLACFDGVGACSLAASFRRVTQVKGRDWGRSHHQIFWWQIFIVVWREKRGGEMLVLMTKMKRMTTIVYVKTAGLHSTTGHLVLLSNHCQSVRKPKSIWWASSCFYNHWRWGWGLFHADDDNVEVLQAVGSWLPWTPGPRAVWGNCFPLWTQWPHLAVIRTQWPHLRNSHTWETSPRKPQVGSLCNLWGRKQTGEKDLWQN